MDHEFADLTDFKSIKSVIDGFWNGFGKLSNLSKIDSTRQNTIVDIAYKLTMDYGLDMEY